MKKLLIALLATFSLWSCTDAEKKKYSGKEIDFQLFQSSSYDFSGNVVVRELVNGSLELTLKLDGTKTSSDYSFPAHLHFGSYDQANTSIAFLLNPVSAKNLESVTVLGTLSNGNTLNFESMKSFDGHLKIHLANEGPDYGVILVAGNIGANASAKFDAEKMAACSNSF
jgi:hypothetical protein